MCKSLNQDLQLLVPSIFYQNTMKIKKKNIAPGSEIPKYRNVQKDKISNKIKLISMCNFYRKDSSSYNTVCVS